MKFRATICTIFCILFSYAASIEIPPEVPRPPRITQQPNEITYAIGQVGIVLKCAADALPEVSTTDGYRWEKDGNPLAVAKSGNNSIVMSSTDGTITFMGSEKLSEQELSEHEGIYQCFATNDYGTAMTNEITLKAAKSPYQQPQDVGLTPRVGESLQFKCNFDSNAGQTITWSFNKPGFTLSDRVSQTSEGGLVFANVIANDDKLEFYCIVKDLATRKSTDGTHYLLKVDKANPVPDREPAIISPSNSLEPQIQLKGDTLTLKCAATGKPTPTIEWSKLSGNWPTDRYTVQDSGHTVVITNASYSDDADYRCTATNYLGSAIATTSVQVQSRPFFASDESKPRDVVQTPGGSVEIRCDVEGLPTPTTSWRINGVPIDEAPEMTNRDVSPNLIRLWDLKSSDSSVYQCVTKNTHGTLIEQAFVNVLTSRPIPLDSNKAVYQQVEGKSVDIECHVFGSPPATIFWRPLVDRMEMFDNNSVLRINAVQSSDSGTYKCLASNEFGNAEVDFILEVLQPTSLSPVNGSTQYAELGKSVTMELELDIDDQLQPGPIRWEKNNIPVCSGVTCTISGLSFDDAGDYKVSVNTSLDGATTNINLVVRGKPNAPLLFQYTTTADPLVVNFRWESAYDNNAPVEEYKVEFEENQFAPGIWRTLKSGILPNQTSIAVTLSPFVNYQFRAIARNVVGWGKTSNVVGRYQTPSGAPVLNPTGVTGKGTDSDNMLIKWKPVKQIDQNGPGFAYIVSYCLAKSCTRDGPWMKAEVDGSTTMYEVKQTPVYEKYFIKVQSFNNDGNAPEPKVEVGYSGEDTPVAYPLNVQVETDEKNPTIARLSWEPVANVDVRGKLRGYVVSYRKPGESWNEVTVGNVTNATVTGLDPYMVYQFAVSVFNTKSVGRRSEFIRIKTPESIPGAPSNLRVVDKTATSLMFDWDSPKTPNGKITGYVLTCKAVNSTSEDSEIELLEPGLKLESLSPAKVYEITVAAKTAKGVGTEKALTQVSTHPEGAPGKVKFNATVDETNVTVTWQKPEGLPADKYFVESRRRDSNEWNRIGTYSNEQTEKPVAFSSFDPVSTYYVRIVAVNPYGESTTSPVVVEIGGTAINQGSITGEIWFIVIIALVVLLVIVLVLICLLRKKRGGKYSVAEKEGRLVDTESNVSNRQEVGEYNDEKDDEIKKPLAPKETTDIPSNGDASATPSNGVPLLAARTRGDSVGGDSIDAFADAEAREFNEDGSFIGQYGTIPSESVSNSAATSPGEQNGDAV